jgi:hypothetical protein
MLLSSVRVTSIGWKDVGYAAACVVVPLLWGIAVVWASNWIESRLLGRDKRKRRARREVPPIEYHI